MVPFTRRIGAPLGFRGSQNEGTSHTTVRALAERSDAERSDGDRSGARGVSRWLTRVAAVKKPTLRFWRQAARSKAMLRCVLPVSVLPMKQQFACWSSRSPGQLQDLRLAQTRHGREVVGVEVLVHLKQLRLSAMHAEFEKLVREAAAAKRTMSVGA